jgi:predicted metal-dependent hydrolase
MGAATERSEIQFGLTRIPFLIRRSSRRETVALTIDSGKLVVTAPAGTTIDKLNAVVRHKGPWVVERIKRVREAAAPPVSAREFVTGETVLYLGRQYRLRVVDGDRGPRIKAGWYEVPVPSELSEHERQREVRRRLLGSIKQHADLYLPDRLTEVCRRLRVAGKPSMIVREQRKRWGSCDVSGTLRINWRIVQAPIALIDYVLVHELAHIEHRGHDRAFWAAVEQWLPDYEDRRRRLRELGPLLEW